MRTELTTKVCYMSKSFLINKVLSLKMKHFYWLNIIGIEWIVIS